MRINKKYIFFLISFLGTILLSGCNTAGGAGKGFADGTETTIEDTGNGLCTSGGFIKTLDNWIKENFW